jgi:hypothetical protein
MAVEMVAMSGPLAGGAAGQEKLAGRLEVDSSGRIPGSPGTLFLGGDGDQGSLIRRHKVSNGGYRERWLFVNCLTRPWFAEKSRKQKAKK